MKIQTDVPDYVRIAKLFREMVKSKITPAELESIKSGMKEPNDVYDANADMCEAFSVVCRRYPFELPDGSQDHAADENLLEAVWGAIKW